MRVAVPDRSRIRPLSIESVQIPGERIDPAQTITREAAWTPPTDVYILGWNPWIGAPSSVAFDADLQLYQADHKTTVFIYGQRITPPGAVDAWRSYGLPPGTGYKVLRGQKLAFRYRITNKGAQSFDTAGAVALVYFAPVEGN